MQDGTADYAVEMFVRKRQFFDRRGFEIFGRQIGRESSGETFYLRDGFRFSVNGEDVAAYPHKKDHIPPAAASGVEDFHTGRESTFLKLVEQVNVNVAEDFPNIFHRLILTQIAG